MVENGDGGVEMNSTCKAFPSINMELTGKRIVELRKLRGLKVIDLQNYFGFEYPQAIYKWQHGESLPSVDNLLGLAVLLQVRIEDILVVNGQESPLIFLLFFFMLRVLRPDGRSGSR